MIHIIYIKVGFFSLIIRLTNLKPYNFLCFTETQFFNLNIAIILILRIEEYFSEKLQQRLRKNVH